MNTQTLEYLFQQAKSEQFKNTSSIEALIRELVAIKSYNESIQTGSETYLRG